MTKTKRVKILREDGRYTIAKRLIQKREGGRSFVKFGNRDIEVIFNEREGIWETGSNGAAPIEEQIKREEEEVLRSGVDLQDYIPSKPENGYIYRKEFERKLDICFKKKEPVLLVGETGSGKTKAIEHFCGSNGIPLYDVSCSFELNLRELFGYRILVEGKTVWQEGRLVPFIQSGRPVCICFNEVNRVGGEKLTILFKMLQDRIVEVYGADKTYSISKDVWIVFTANPSGKYDVFKIDPAIVSRMAVIEVGFFTEKELKKFYRGRIEAELLNKLVKFLERAREFVIKSRYKIEFNLRNLDRFIDYYKDSGSVLESLEIGFLDSVYLMGGEEQRKNIKEIAAVHFELEEKFRAEEEVGTDG